MTSRTQKNISDWRDLKLGQIATLTSSKRVYLSDYVKMGIPFYRGKEISQLKRKETIDDLLYISSEAYSSFKDKYGAPKADDILITAVGTLGNIYRVEGDKPFYFKDGNLIWLRDIKENAAFLEYLLSCEKNKLINSAIGSSQKALTIVALNKIKFSLPPLPEQNRIVKVLETWDKAIEVLVKKIEHKKEIKKGLTQNLLTGKIRLSGFSDKWEEVTLGEICKIRTGKKDVNEGNPNGQYPFFTCAKENTYSDLFSFDAEAILIAGNGEVGNCQYYKGKFEAYQRTYVLTDFKHEVFYVFPYLRYFFQNSINSQKQMGAMPYIKLGMLKDFEIKIPKTKEEQVSIAKLLNTADSEITELEGKLALLKDQKTYLLNNLITGIIRTPENI